MSSENMGDMIVENGSITTTGLWSYRLGLVTNPLTWSDRRTLRCDKSRSSVDREPESADGSTQNYLLSEPSLVRADLKSDHLVTKRCPLLPWNSGVAAGVLVGPD